MKLKNLFTTFLMLISITSYTSEAHNRHDLLELGSLDINLIDQHNARVLPILSLVKGSNFAAAKANKSKIENMIKSIISSKKTEDLLSMKGKTSLNNEIKTKVNRLLIKSQIAKVYYKSFQIN